MIFKWIKKYVKTANPIYSPNFNPHDWRIVVNGRVSFSFSEPAHDWIAHFKHSRCNSTVIYKASDLICFFAGIDELPRDVSIYFNTTGAREVRIFSDGGRLIRPLCVVKNGKLLLTSQDITSLKTRGGGLQNVSLGKLKFALSYGPNQRVGKLKFVLSWQRLIPLAC